MNNETAYQLFTWLPVIGSILVLILTYIAVLMTINLVKK